MLAKIATYENVIEAYRKALRGNRQSLNVITFQSNFDTNISEIVNGLTSGRLIIHPYHIFEISDPKKRTIAAPTFYDRVEQHALMNICHKPIDNRLLPIVYASRPGKGIYAALSEAMRLAREQKYYVKLDVRKYFDSIDHTILIEQLQRVFRETKLLRMFDQIISSYHSSNNKGVPIGNLTSQYFANLYLARLDWWMKCHCEAKGYVRYMDDVVMYGESKEVVKRLSDQFCKYAQDFLKLEIKVPLYGKTETSIPFLGYKVYRYHLNLLAKSKKRFRTKIMKLYKDYMMCMITEKEFAIRCEALTAYAKHGETLNFRRSIISKMKDIG